MIKNNYDDYIEINSSATPVGTVIWLHGLGADGQDFVPVAQELNLPPQLPLRFIFPHAPFQPVTINNGYVMRAWYDIVSMHIDQHADEKGIQNAIERVHTLIAQEEQKGIPTHRIILAGFSQGAVVTLAAGLHYPKKLAGLLALSGYLPNPQEATRTASVANQQTAIFIGHGTADTIVPCQLGETVATVLKQAGYPVSWHPYDIPHTVCAEEMRDIRQWMIDQLNV